MRETLLNPTFVIQALHILVADCARLKSDDECTTPTLINVSVADWMRLSDFTAGDRLAPCGGLVGDIGQEAMRLLHEGVETARRTREVVGIAADLDRNARQIQVLKDPALALIYHDRHLKLLQQLQAIAATSLSAATLASNDELRRLAIELDRVIVDPSVAAALLAQHLSRSQKLLTESRRLELLGRERFDNALHALGEATDAARRALNAQGLAPVPINYRHGNRRDHRRNHRRHRSDWLCRHSMPPTRTKMAT